MASILKLLKQGNSAFLLTGTSKIDRVREGQQSLGNAIELLDKGYPIETDAEKIINYYGGIKEVPEASEHLGFPDESEEE